jgi:glucosylglycerate phosphorylase
MEHGHATTLQRQLTFLYGGETAEAVLPRLQARLDRTRRRLGPVDVPPPHRVTQRDAFVITYADQVRFGREAPLRTLARLLDEHLADVVTGVHVLPFYPWTSDDGFSVVDYRAVAEDLGDWSDVSALARRYRLMVDAVINHVSAASPEFQGFLHGDGRFERRFIVLDPDTDLSAVVRPRTTPVLTRFDTARGEKYVWTTFSEDQIDLDYADPEVLLDVIDVVLTYVERGARTLRLDAVAFLWKTPGTGCINLPQTHAVIKLLRSCLEAAAPDVVVVTETNVPHAENCSYFGDGHDEAQMVYNFALPPLVAHAVTTGSAGALREWAQGLATPSDETTFFNFLASHDGVGLRPVEGILTEHDVERLVRRAEAHGGRVSYRDRSGAEPAPYELNISLFDLLNDPRRDEPLVAGVERFLTAHAVMLALPGVPGLYVHSVLGSRNAAEELERTGRARSINRGRFEWCALTAELADPGHRRRLVLDGFRRLMAVRARHSAFHPQAPQSLPDAPDELLVVRRRGVASEVLCVQNLADRGVRAQVAPLLRGSDATVRYRDVHGGPWSHDPELLVAPRETRWLELPLTS